MIPAHRNNPLPTQLPQWQQLQHLAQKPWSLTQLFDQQQDRAQKFSVQAAGIYFDYSKQCLDESVKEQLIQLAEACGLPQRIQSLYQGDKVNSSEDRAALHTALRLPKTA